MRLAFARMTEQGSERMLVEIFHSWKDEVGGTKMREQESAMVKQLETSFQQYEAATVAKAKKIMSRFAGDNDHALCVRLFQGWRQASSEQRASREMQAQVEEKQRQLEALMKEKKEATRKMFEAAFTTAPTVILQGVWRSWMDQVVANRATRSIRTQIESGDGLLSALRMRRQAAALGFQDRVSGLEELNTLLRILQAWDLETKLNRVEKRYKGKMDSKRKQLTSVRTLFRSFAEKLEEGLTVEDGSEPALSGRGMSKGNPHTASLPSLRPSSASIAR
eukprot:SRR837773.15447.p1 GENE.SRR837773.15447~~SRR837773.15447.p1  ORF type:complete len:278 (+),score=86.92 SRR837773.15447:2-835(+)